MSCGCKNCNGAVSLPTQLPPGCDSILNIGTQLVDDNVLVTITFCSGAIQQFTIPAGQNGTDGVNGVDGATGPSGTGISDVDITQEGNEVTLVITLSDGTVINETFIIQAAPSAYVVDSQHFDTTTPVLLTNDTNSVVLASSTIPGNTINVNGDTIDFDILFRLNYTLAVNIATGEIESIAAVFKSFYLSLGPLGGLIDADEIFNNLSFPNFNSSIRQIRIRGKMTKIESPALGTNAMNIMGSLELYDKAETDILSNGLGGDVTNTMPALRFSYGFYSGSAQGLDFENNLQFQVLATPATYAQGSSVLVDPLYFVTTKIPKL